MGRSRRQFGRGGGPASASVRIPTRQQCGGTRHCANSLLAWHAPCTPCFRLFPIHLARARIHIRICKPHPWRPLARSPTFRHCSYFLAECCPSLPFHASLSPRPLSLPPPPSSPPLQVLGTASSCACWRAVSVPRRSFGSCCCPLSSSSSSYV
jgi:hypothetical protein